MRWAAAALALAGLVVLYHYPPGPGTIYPLCPFRLVTGHACPGCGSTHALYALLHGRVMEAFQHNAPLTCGLPLALAWCAARRRSLFTTAAVPGPRASDRG